jgi:hypothetical protein
MTLSALIRKRDTRNLATAIPAISATQPKDEPATVARIATVAVANPKEEKTAPPAKVGAAEIARPTPSMREAHEVYLAHHWRCPTCCAAGQGCGSRCAEGARLWDAYSEAAQRRREAASGARREGPPEIGDPRDPATDAEIARMAERTEAFERMGLTPDEVDWAVDRLLRRDRDLDDRRLCIECAHIRTSGMGWRCGALRQSLPRELVIRLQRCPSFFGAMHATNLQPR